MLRKLLRLGLITGVSVTIAGAAFYLHLLYWAEQPLNDSDAALEPLVTQLAPGESLATLAQRLTEAKFIRGQQRLLLLGRLTGMDRRLHVGEYRIEANITPMQLLTKLGEGDVVTYAFRIEEGSTVAVMLENLAAEEPMRHTLQAVDAQTLHTELGLSAPFAEGMFFPDTYQYRRGDLDRDLLLRAHNALLARLGDAWQQRHADIVLDTPEQAVILASIIEKESGLESDRSLVSQVFHNRLAEGMLLQTDPTVIYALGDAFDGNLTRAHLRIDSPFNTYRYRGLPPTPIALPSAAALLAAVQPAAGDYLYFVARGDGSSAFSRTLAEHNRAVRKYQLGQSD